MTIDDDAGARFDARMRQIAQLHAELDAKGSPFEVRASSSKEEILEQVAKSLLAPHVDDIARGMRPCTRLTLEAAALDGLPLGGSRLGGPPDLPPDFEWPTWSPPRPLEDGAFGPFFRWVRGRLGGGSVQEGVHTPVKLAFIGQIRVSDLAAAGEPVLGDEGVLYFFFDTFNAGGCPDEQEGHRVCFWAGPTERLSRHPQRELPTDTPRFTVEDPPSVPHRIAFRPGWRAARNDLGEIDYDSEEKKWCFGKLEDALSGKQLDWDRVLDVPGQVQQGLWRSCELIHRGLGYGDDLPDDVTDADIEAGEAEWRLLLQLDGHDEIAPEWWWNDGCLYFCIKQQDLEAKRFDRVVCVKQGM
jgi:uncharacterized protein YwqG